MHNPKVKICGITNIDDALVAVECGADILGFNFYDKSPRCIEPKKAVEIIKKLPSFVDIAGVFVNEKTETIYSIAADLHLDWIQLHGDETPGYCAQLESANAYIIKAIRIKDRRDVDYAQNFSTDVLLLDAFDPHKYGGTGKRLNWQDLPDMVHHIYGRLFLAGGITPDNVRQAYSLGFFGIDVCSGVESSPGKKDHEKLRTLFDNIRIKNNKRRIMPDKNISVER